MWQYAIEQMKQGHKRTYGPESFIGYCDKHQLSKGLTANHISIDYFEKLPRQLKEENLMVIRLGSVDKKAGTDFMLIKYEEPEDFFFFDKDHFNVPMTHFEADPAVKNALSIIKVFSNYSEMMLVSYLLSSGALSEVLNLDKTQIYYTPLTGRNNYTFDFYPFIGSDLVTHQNGQVEIDAVFTGYKDGKPVVVVAEAKVESSKYASLAKHKLFYAYKSIQSVLQGAFEIIPVYLKLGVKEDILTAKVAVCRDVGGCLAGFEVVDVGVVRVGL